MISDPQFWVLISFLIFIAAIYRPVKKILLLNLDKKINEIKDSIVNAEKLKNESQQTLSEIKKRQNQVNLEIENIKKDTINRITEMEDQSDKKLDFQITKRKELAESKIEQIKRDATNEIRNFVILQSMTNVKKILSNKLDIKEKDKLIDSSLKEIDLRLKN